MPLDKEHLRVLNAGTLELTIEARKRADSGDPLAQIVQPNIRKVHGKVLQMLGFDNRAVQALLQGR